MNDEKEITTIIKRNNGNGSLKVTVKNVGIIAVVVGVALTVYGFIETKADKTEIDTISAKLDSMQSRLIRIETLLEAKK